MGWLGGIFGREEKKEEPKVSLKDVEKLVADKIEESLEPLKSSIKDEYANMKNVANYMQDQLDELEQATYPESTYPFLVGMSTGSRKSFVGRMKLVIDQIQKPMGKDMESILGFYDETDRLINATNAETIKQYALLKILFEKEGKDVLQYFRQIFEINGNLGKMVKEVREHNSKLLKAKESVSSILSLTEELGKNQIDLLDKTIKIKEAEARKVGDDIQRLLGSDEWKEFLEMQSARDEMKAEMEGKKSEFLGNMSKLEVPLRKYNWSAKKKILDDYISRSFDSVLCEDPKGESLLSALRDMKVKIIEGEMIIKDTDKFLAAIDSAKENNTIGVIIEEYSRLSDVLKKLEEEISSQEVLKRKTKLESEKSRLEKEAEGIKDEKKTVGEQTKKNLASKEQKINELKDMLADILGNGILLETN